MLAALRWRSFFLVVATMIANRRAGLSLADTWWTFGAHFLFHVLLVTQDVWHQGYTGPIAFILRRVHDHRINVDESVKVLLSRGNLTLVLECFHASLGLPLTIDLCHVLIKAAGPYRKLLVFILCIFRFMFSTSHEADNQNEQYEEHSSNNYEADCNFTAFTLKEWLVNLNNLALHWFFETHWIIDIAS